MEGIVEYMVVRASSIDRDSAISDLERQVNGWIMSGWRPQGGMTLVQHNANASYLATQAMVR